MRLRRFFCSGPLAIFLILLGVSGFSPTKAYAQATCGSVTDSSDSSHVDTNGENTSAVGTQLFADENGCHAVSTGNAQPYVGEAAPNQLYVFINSTDANNYNQGITFVFGSAWTIDTFSATVGGTAATPTILNPGVTRYIFATVTTATAFEAQFQMTRGTGTFHVTVSKAANSDTLAATDIKAGSLPAPNTAPSITSNGGNATAAITVNENQTAVTDVQSTDAQDSEGSGLTYSKTGGADQALFDLNANTGVLTFVSAPDFESPNDAGGNNIYDVQVTVTDLGGLTDSQDIAVTVADVGEVVSPPVNSVGISIITVSYAPAGSPNGYQPGVDHINAQCGGKFSCDYLISTSLIGDPFGGIRKEYSVTYICNGGGNNIVATVAAEASGQTVNLSCPLPANPATTITTDSGGLFNQSAPGSFTATVTFTEPITGFVDGELTASNATVGTLNPTGGAGTTFSATITPTGTGDIALNVAAAVAKDVDNNDNTAASQVTVKQIDDVKPTVAISGVPSATDGTTAFTATFTFSEDVTGFDLSDITAALANATASDFATPTANRVFTAKITPDGNGNVSVGVNANAAADAAANGNTAATTQTATLDASAPPVVVSGVPSVTDGTTAFTATFTFSEDVSGFDLSDVTAALANATASDFATTTAHRVFTAKITPDGNGNVSVGVNANAAEDVATNGNTAATTRTATLDASAPTVAILNAPASHDGSSAFVVTFQFSEGVTGFMSGDIMVGNGSASNFVAVDGDTYTATITPSGPQDVTIDVAAGVAQDNAGNPNQAATQVSVGGTVVAETTEMIGSFIQSRGNLITQIRPDQSRRVDRVNATDTNNGGVSGFGMSVVSGRLPFQVKIGAESSGFSYSLRRATTEGAKTHISADPMAMLAHAGVTPTRPLAATSSRPAPTDAVDDAARLESFGSAPRAVVADANSEGGIDQTRRFDLWVEGKYSQYTAGNGGGDFTVLHAGADYLVTRDLLVGLAIQLDWMTYARSTGTGKADGSGYMVGPYLTAKFSDGFYLDAAASWGRADNSASPFATFTDEFGSQRWLATGALIGNFDSGGFNIRPEARLSYFREQTDAYTNGIGTAIPGLTFETGTLDFGPTLSRTIALHDALSLTPHAGAKGIWTFASTSTADRFQTNPQTLAREGLRMAVDAGLTLATENGTHLTLSGAYDGIGDNSYEAWSIKAGLGLRW